MTAMKEIRTVQDLTELDPDAILSGYRAGYGFIPLDHTRTDQAYWHGYWNAHADRNPGTATEAQSALAADYFRRSNAN